MINYVQEGHVIWIQGLAGCGKTSVAIELKNLLKNDGYPLPVALLDGDEVRNALGLEGLHYQTRLSAAKIYARLAAYLSAQNILVIVSAVCLIKEAQDYNRVVIANYFEVFLDVPSEIASSRAAIRDGTRNPIAAERRSLSGNETHHFPTNADLHLTPVDESVSDISRQILQAFKLRSKWL